MPKETVMRAKFKVDTVLLFQNGEEITLSAVTNAPGEDNTFAKFTPQASLKMTITNDKLLGTIKPGRVFYVDFSEAV